MGYISRKAEAEAEAAPTLFTFNPPAAAFFSFRFTLLLHPVFGTVKALRLRVCMMGKGKGCRKEMPC